MKRIFHVLLSSAACLLLPALTAESGEPGGSLTGVYSSLKPSQRSGDLVGMEFFVLQGATSLHAVLQGSEGAPGNPIVVPLKTAGNAVSFSIPANCSCALPQGDYVAELSRGGAKLRGPREFGEKQLARTNSYWQGL